MRVVFFEPPPAQRAGGLEAAVHGLRGALEMVDVQVGHELPRGASADDIQAVHFHGLWQPRYARIAAQCRKAGIPFVISPHGMLELWAWRHKAWKKWPYYYLIERPLLRRAACVLATAESEAERLAKFLPGRRIESLPLGTTSTAMPDYGNARVKLDWKSDERVLLFLSRIHVKKGLNLLLKALTEIPIPNNTRLVIVGGGDPEYVESLNTMVREYQAQLPRVDWIGEVWGEERWAYFQGADLFCLPTYSENFGLVVLEALQVGTPVLTTHTTPWAEHLHSDRGFLAHPSVESLKPVLSEFFAQPPQPSEVRNETAQWAHSTFSWSNLAPRYRTLYQGLRNGG